MIFVIILETLDFTLEKHLNILVKNNEKNKINKKINKSYSVLGYENLCVIDYKINKIKSTISSIL